MGFNEISIPMDPAVASERKYDWGMMTSSSGVSPAVASQTVAMDPS